MKNLFFILTGLFINFSTSSPAEANKTIQADEDFCDQSYTIDGGPGCVYNGTYDGWCSQSEFNEFADDVYASSGCNEGLSPV